MASDKSADEVAVPFDSQLDLGLSCLPVRVHFSMSGIVSPTAQAATYWHFTVEMLVGRRGDFHVEVGSRRYAWHISRKHDASLRTEVTCV